MSVALFVAFMGLFALPWTVAGLIHPPAAWVSGLRWKVLIKGVVAFVAALAIAKLLSGPPPEVEVNGSDDGVFAITGLWLLACIAWPFIALVGRVKGRAALIPEAVISAPDTVPSSIKLSIDECHPDSVVTPTPVQAKVNKQAQPSAKPAPLTNQQRKILSLPVVRSDKAPTAPPAEQPRAIRTGWRLCEVEFKYKDSKGETTVRTVTVHWVGDSSFKGECHYRRAERTFRLDRVIGEITDTETGEMLKPKKWATEYS